MERIKKFKQTTRWLANSAFQTYYGKPAFGPYGFGNTKPINGGCVYGDQMLTYNINPIRGGNNPERQEVYPWVERYYDKLKIKPNSPPRKCKAEF